MSNFIAYVILVALFVCGITTAGRSISEAAQKEHASQVQAEADHAAVIFESTRIARYISDLNQGTCQEQNLKYYWWFRSKGICPLVQVGKKLGSWHLWLQWDDKIFDATDWKYNGMSVTSLKDIYVVGVYDKYPV